MRSVSSLSPLVHILTLAALLGCNALGGLVPAPTPGAASQTRPAVQLPLATTQLMAVEEAAWEALREPLRETLGPDADALFHTVDQTRAAAASQAAQAYLGRSWAPSRPPGMAQQGITAAGVVSLMPLIVGQIGRTPELGKMPFNKDDQTGDTGVQSTITPSLVGDTLTVEMKLSVSASQNGATLQETTTATAEMVVCPDSQGAVKLSVHMTMSSTATSGTATDLGQLEATGEANGQVNDDAELAGYSTDVTVGRSSQVTDSSHPEDTLSQYAEATTRAEHTIGETSYTSRTTVNRTSSQATQAIIDTATRSSLELLDGLIASWLDAGRQLWQNGYCVEIVVTDADDINNVKAGSSNSFSAGVRHKFEGVELQVPLEASLSGGESLVPTGKADAPVDYTYQAPGEEMRSATVTLVTKSRRGIAKKGITFITSTPNYHAIAPPYTWSGVVCSLDQPFSLSHTGELVGSYSFTPDSGASGTVTMKQTVGPCELTASGTYAIDFASGGSPQADVIMNVSGTMVCAGQAAPLDTQLRILLEPIDDPTCH